jgi:SAM-dependent methyltransferase
MNDVMSGGMHRLWKDHFVHLLSPAQGIRHLDVAGGTGDIAFRILRKLRRNGAFDCEVTVLDINEAMIAEGKKRAEGKKLAGMVQGMPAGALARICSCSCSPFSQFTVQCVGAAGKILILAFVSLVMAIGALSDVHSADKHSLHAQTLSGTAEEVLNSPCLSDPCRLQQIRICQQVRFCKLQVRI